ncbi:MAG: hypothetical protein IJ313_00585 [Clostridia bacterium]|nr:hypothetical protein [Clostridia bacterium]
MADTAEELGEMLGMRKQIVYQYISRTAEKERTGKPFKSMLRLYKVVTEDGERCPACGKLFYPRVHKQIFCSRRCQRKPGGRKEKT